MKTIILLGLMLMSTLVWAQKDPFKVKGGYQIDIQTSAICGMCKEAIEYDLVYTGGIKKANLDLDTKVIAVQYNPKKITPDEIRKRIAKVGYNADNIKRDPAAYEKLPMCCKDGSHESGEGMKHSEH